MSRLLRSRAWSVLALLAGITSLWAGDVFWLRLVCAAGLAIGITQQLALLAFSIRMRTLGTFRFRLSAATMLCAGVACCHSSLPIGTVIISALLARNATVIFRPHPANRKLPEAAAAIAAIDELLRPDAESTSRPHRWGAAASDPTFGELANAADAMVADV